MDPIGSRRLPSGDKVPNSAYIFIFQIRLRLAQTNAHPPGLSTGFYYIPKKFRDFVLKENPVAKKVLEKWKTPMGDIKTVHFYIFMV